MASSTMSQLANTVNGRSNNNNYVNANSNTNGAAMMSSNNINASFSSGSFSPILKSSNANNTNASNVPPNDQPQNQNPNQLGLASTAGSPPKKVGFDMSAAARLALGLKKAGKAASVRVADRRMKEKDISFEQNGAEEADFNPASPSRPARKNPPTHNYQLNGQRSDSVDSLAMESIPSNHQDPADATAPSTQQEVVSEQMIRPPTWSLIQQNAVAAANRTGSALDSNNNNNNNKSHSGKLSRETSTLSAADGFLSWAGQDSPSQQRKYSPVRIAREAIQKQKAAELKVRERLLAQQYGSGKSNKLSNSSMSMTGKSQIGNGSMILSPGSATSLPGQRPQTASTGSHPVSRSNSPSKMSVATSNNNVKALVSSSSRGASPSSKNKVNAGFSNFSFAAPVVTSGVLSQSPGTNTSHMLSSAMRPLGTPPLAPSAANIPTALKLNNNNQQQLQAAPVSIDPNVYSSMSPEEQWAYYYSVVSSQQQQQQQQVQHGRNDDNNLRHKIHKERLARFYQKYAPDNIAKIDQILEKYRGNEEVLFEAIRLKYGPEPPPPSSASPSPAPLSTMMVGKSTAEKSQSQSQHQQPPPKQSSSSLAPSPPPNASIHRVDSDMGGKPLEQQSTMLFSASPNLAATSNNESTMGSRPASFSMPPAAVSSEKPATSSVPHRAKSGEQSTANREKEALIHFYLEYAAGQIDTNNLTQDQIQQLHLGAQYYQEREAAAPTTATTTATADQQQPVVAAAAAAAVTTVTEAEMQGHSRDDLITFYLQYAQGMIDASTLTPDQIQLLHVAAKLYQDQMAQQELEEAERQKIAYERAMEHQRQQAEQDDFDDDEMEFEYEEGEEAEDNDAGHRIKSRATQLHEMAVQTDPVKIITPGLEMTKAKEFLAKKKAIELRKLADSGNVVHLGELAGPRVPPIDAKKVIDSLVTTEEKKKILQSVGAQKLLFKDVMAPQPTIASAFIAGTMIEENFEYDSFGNIIGRRTDFQVNKKPDSRHKAVPGVGAASMKDKMDSWFTNIAGESGLGLKTPFLVKLNSATSTNLMNRGQSQQQENQLLSTASTGGANNMSRRGSGIQLARKNSFGGFSGNNNNNTNDHDENFHEGNDRRAPSSQPDSETAMYEKNLIPQDIGKFKKSPVDASSVSWRAVASQIAAARKARDQYQQQQQQQPVDHE